MELANQPTKRRRKQGIDIVVKRKRKKLKQTFAPNVEVVLLLWSITKKYRNKNLNNQASYLPVFFHRQAMGCIEKSLS